MPLQATSGAASYDAFGGGVPVTPVYIEDVMSTFLYTGNSSTQTITNGIDLAGEGGLVWVKYRSGSPSFTDHFLMDSVRGVDNELNTNNTSAQGSLLGAMSSFNSNGFTLGNGFRLNQDTIPYASWTFRKQPKFFDVVTYTGTGTAGRTVAHNLGSTPGCIIVKRTDASIGWPVYHRGLTSLDFLLLDATSGSSTAGSFWDDTNPTSTNFTVGSSNYTNASGATYVAYLFAHDAGGFGLTGTDNVISCGSFNYNTFPQTVELGYEPQWLMVKRTDGVGDWVMYDVMRGFTANAGSGNELLNANTSDAAASVSRLYYGSATGFNLNLSAYGTYIYIAIRRGPMKVPTTGTSVFAPIASSSNTGTAQTTNFPVDLQIMSLTNAVENKYVADRLRGVITTPTNATSLQLRTNSTANELTGGSDFTRYWNNNGFETPSWFGDNYAINGYSGVFWNFRRAPGFFDEVCYTGNSTSGATQTHNLGVVPELMIVKRRNTATDWYVYSAAVGATKFTVLNSTAAPVTATNAWNNTAPTSAVFTLGTAGEINNSSGTYVAYLFATCPGVSKVGSYTGNGTTQAIACGFTGGARFVLIKATSTTGDWLTFDTARGMTVLTDPVLKLNSTAAETATLGACTTTTGGFTVNESILAGVNTSGVSFVFLAIA